LPTDMATYLARSDKGGLTVMKQSLLIWTKDHMWQYPLDAVYIAAVSDQYALVDLRNGRGVVLDVGPASKGRGHPDKFKAAAETTLEEWYRTESIWPSGD